MSNQRNMQGWRNRGVKDALRGDRPQGIFPKYGCEFYYNQGYEQGQKAPTISFLGFSNESLRFHLVPATGTELIRDYHHTQITIDYRVFAVDDLRYMGALSDYNAYPPGCPRPTAGGPFRTLSDAVGALWMWEHEKKAEREEAHRLYEEQERTKFMRWVDNSPWCIPNKFLADVLAWSVEVNGVAAGQRVTELKAEITKRLTAKGERF